MSDQTKTAVLKIEIDRQSALKGLIESEKAIVDLKKSQKDLNDEFKAGKVSLEQYAKIKVEFDSLLKREIDNRKVLKQAIDAEKGSRQEEKALLASLIQQRDRLNRTTEDGIKKHDDLNKRIKELNESLKKAETEGGTYGRNVGNYGNKILDAAGNIGIFQKGLALLSNPLTLATAGVTALAAAYSSSAASAKSLHETQNLLKSEFQVFSGALGGEISEKEGLGTKITRYATGIGKGILAGAAYVISGFNNQVIESATQEEKQVDKVYQAYNKLKEAQLEQMQNQIQASKLRKEAFELTVIRGNEELSIEKRLQAAQKITENLKESREESVEALKQQAQQLLIIGELTNNNVLDNKNISALREQYLSLLVQINDAEASRARKIAAAESAERKLNEELNKKGDIKGYQGNSNIPTFGSKLSGARSAETLLEPGLKNFQETAQKEADIYDFKAKKYKEDQKKKEEADKNKIKSEQAVYDSTLRFSRAASQILGQNSQEYKAISSIDATVATYLAADKALAEVPYPANFFAAASVIAEGIANVVSINKAAGGGSFMTKGPTMLLVGDNPGGQERIDVTPISGKGETTINRNSNLIAMAGGGSITTGDGGLFTNNSTAQANQTLMMANAIKSMPAPIVSWKEGLIIDQRINFKEGLTRK